MQKLLNLRPMPRVIHINPWAFIIVCFFMAMVVGVLFYSVTGASHVQQKTNSLPSTSMEAENDKRWYKNVPDATVHTQAMTANLSSETELSRQQAAILKQAMESPIKAPIEGLPTIENKNTERRAEREAVYPDSQTAASPLSEKENFLNKLSEAVDDDVLHEPLKKPFSLFILQAGTLLPATLAGSINSDLPGQLSALVNQNVYDSINGHHLLVPQGSKLILVYDANVAYGQQRLLVAVKRLIFPDGRSMDLKNMPAVDVSGQTGFHDQVNNHYMRIFGSAAMLGVITGGFQLSQATSPQGNNTIAAPSVSQVMGNAMGEQMEQVAMGMMNKNLDIAPQLIVRPGYQFNVQVTKDLVFPGAY